MEMTSFHHMPPPPIRGSLNPLISKNGKGKADLSFSMDGKALLLDH